MAFKKKNARRGRRTSRRSKPTVKRAIRKVKKQRMSGLFVGLLIQCRRPRGLFPTFRRHRTACITQLLHLLMQSFQQMSYKLYQEWLQR